MFLSLLNVYQPFILFAYVLLIIIMSVCFSIPVYIISWCREFIHLTVLLNFRNYDINLVIQVFLDGPSFINNFFLYKNILVDCVRYLSWRLKYFSSSSFVF